MAPTIVYYQNLFPVISETFVRAEIAELLRRGLDVRVVCNEVIPENMFDCSFPEQVICTRGNAERARQILSELKPAYIHTHFVTESLAFALPHAHALGIPFGFTCHAYDIWKQIHRVEPEILRELANHPLCVTCAAEGTRHAAYLEWCGVPAEKIVIVPNTVSQQSFPKRRDQSPSSVKNLVAVGRPVPKKGFLVAIDAVRLLRLQNYKVNLQIFGPVLSETVLGKRIVEVAKGFPFIKCQPMRPHQEILQAISQADALLMPCIVGEDGDSDGIPTVLTEAMLLGVPVITSDVGSIKDLVIDGQTGLLARSGDPASLAEKIVELDKLLADSSRRDELIERAYAQASAREIKPAVTGFLDHLEKRICLGMPSEAVGEGTTCDGQEQSALFSTRGAKCDSTRDSFQPVVSLVVPRSSIEFIDNLFHSSSYRQLREVVKAASTVEIVVSQSPGKRSDDFALLEEWRSGRTIPLSGEYTTTAELNWLARSCRGKWLLFFEENCDLVEENFLELVQMLPNLDAEMVYGNSYISDGQCSFLPERFQSPTSWKEVKVSADPEIAFGAAYSLSGPAFLLQRSLFFKLGGFDEDLQILHSHNLLIRAIAISKHVQMDSPLLSVRQGLSSGEESIRQKLKELWLNQAIFLELVETPSKQLLSLQEKASSELISQALDWGVTAEQLIEDWSQFLKLLNSLGVTRIPGMSCLSSLRSEILI